MSDRQRLKHILDAISEIEAYTKDVDLRQFMDHSMMRFACIKQIEIIGEAANYITPKVREKFPDIPWL